MCCCLWVSMYRMLAYRAEDISKRLVPHELYVREELEESVQFDVSSSVWASCDEPTFSHLLPLSLSLSLSLLASCFQSSCIFFHISLHFLTTYILLPPSSLSYHDRISLSFPPFSTLVFPSCILHTPLTLHSSTGGRDVYSDMDEVFCEASTDKRATTTTKTNSSKLLVH